MTETNEAASPSTEDEKSDSESSSESLLFDWDESIAGQTIQSFDWSHHSHLLKDTNLSTDLMIIRSSVIINHWIRPMTTISVNGDVIPLYIPHVLLLLIGSSVDYL